MTDISPSANVKDNLPPMKLDAETAQEIGKALAAEINTPQAQTVEAQIVDDLSGLPKWARGTIYAGLGAAGTLSASVLTFQATNPGVLPQWLVISASLLAAPLGAIVGSSAFANLGKK